MKLRDAAFIDNFLENFYFYIFLHVYLLSIYICDNSCYSAIGMRQVAACITHVKADCDNDGIMNMVAETKHFKFIKKCEREGKTPIVLCVLYCLVLGYFSHVK